MGLCPAMTLAASLDLVVACHHSCHGNCTAFEPGSEHAPTNTQHIKHVSWCLLSLDAGVSFEASLLEFCREHEEEPPILAVLQLVGDKPTPVKRQTIQPGARPDEGPKGSATLTLGSTDLVMLQRFGSALLQPPANQVATKMANAALKCAKTLLVRAT